MQLSSKLNDELIICNVVPLCPKHTAAFGSIELAAIIRDENGRKRTEKPYFYFRFYIF
jgi:hypothetical protein